MKYHLLFWEILAEWYGWFGPLRQSWLVALKLKGEVKISFFLLLYNVHTICLFRSYHAPLCCNLQGYHSCSRYRYTNKSSQIKIIPVLPSSRSDISWGLPGLKGYRLFLSQPFSRTVGISSSNFRLFAMSHYPLLEYVNCKCFYFNTLVANLCEPHPLGNFSSNDTLSCTSTMHCNGIK